MIGYGYSQLLHTKEIERAKLLKKQELAKKKHTKIDGIILSDLQ